MPPALQERLGHHGTLALVTILEAARQEWSVEVMDRTIDKVERRLADEVAGIKISMAHCETAVRLDIKQEVSALRVEVKGDLTRLESTVKAALLDQTRWMFGMWVGQLAATAAIVAGMFRVFAT